jgi:cell division protein ZapA
MAQVSVTIDNKKYRLACDEGEEARLEQLAGLVDEKINELRGAFGEIGDQRLVVMAALSFADQFVEAREAAEAGRGRAEADAARSESLAATLDSLGERIEDLAARLAGGAEA